MGIPLGVRHHFDMTATEAYRSCLRDRIGPALREDGFRGSGSTWSLRSPEGDIAIVNAQSSLSSSKAEVLFIMNLSIVCLPWLRYQGHPIPKMPKEYNGLWRDRLHPSSEVPAARPDRWWSVTDEATAIQAADDVVGQLRSVGVPLLRRLLHREALVATIRTGDLGFFKGPGHTTLFDSALVVLLTDEGRTDEATEALADLREKKDEASQLAFQKLSRWLAE